MIMMEIAGWLVDDDTEHARIVKGPGWPGGAYAESLVRMVDAYNEVFRAVAAERNRTSLAVAEAVAAERERCALVCEQLYPNDFWEDGKAFAAAIRVG